MEEKAKHSLPNCSCLHYSECDKPPQLLSCGYASETTVHCSTVCVFITLSVINRIRHPSIEPLLS